MELNIKLIGNIGRLNKREPFIIAEIISDELNHIAKLTALYTELTGIAENKE